MFTTRQGVNTVSLSGFLNLLITLANLAILKPIGNLLDWPTSSSNLWAAKLNLIGLMYGAKSSWKFFLVNPAGINCSHDSSSTFFTKLFTSIVSFKLGSHEP